MKISEMPTVSSVEDNLIVEVVDLTAPVNEKNKKAPFSKILDWIRKSLGLGDSDALNTSGDAQTKQGNLTVGSKLTIGNTEVTSEQVTFDNVSTFGMQIKNANGYLNVSALNASGLHLYTDRNLFFFNKDVWSIPGGFHSYSTADLRLFTSNTERLRILNSNGNVGIGTTSPEQKLDVNGNIKASQYFIGNTRKDANWDAAYAHKSNNGSDHSYIDQDVTKEASPSFVKVTATENLLAGDPIPNSTSQAVICGIKTQVPDDGIGYVGFSGGVDSSKTFTVNTAYRFLTQLKNETMGGSGKQSFTIGFGSGDTYLNVVDKNSLVRFDCHAILHLNSQEPYNEICSFRITGFFSTSGSYSMLTDIVSKKQQQSPGAAPLAMSASLEFLPVSGNAFSVMLKLDDLDTIAYSWRKDDTAVNFNGKQLKGSFAMEWVEML